VRTISSYRAGLETTNNQSTVNGRKETTEKQNESDMGGEENEAGEARRSS